MGHVNDCPISEPNCDTDEVVVSNLNISGTIFGVSSGLLVLEGCLCCLFFPNWETWCNCVCCTFKSCFKWCPCCFWCSSSNEDQDDRRASDEDNVRATVQDEPYGDEASGSESLSPRLDIEVHDKNHEY